MNTQEVWADVKGYEGIYQVSTLGRIKSLSRFNSPNEKILKPFLVGVNNNQYYAVRLYGVINGGKDIKIHRLIAIAFILNPKDKPCVNHKNGIKADNRISNLEWCTHSENTKHSFDNGLQIPLNGSDIHNSIKVVNIETKEIYHTISDAAKSHNIPRQTLSKWLNGIHPNKTKLRYYE